MRTVAIEFTGATFTRSNANEQFDLMLGVEATIELFVQGILIYSEPMFPIVELGKAISEWMHDTSADFNFVSMESDQAGLVWFEQQPSVHWRVGSVNQEVASNHELSDEEIIAECVSFIKRVDAWVQSELGVRVSDVIHGYPWWQGLSEQTDK